MEFILQVKKARSICIHKPNNLIYSVHSWADNLGYEGKRKKRKLSFYEPNTSGDKLILVGPVCRATDNSLCDANGLAARREESDSWLWAAIQWVGRERGCFQSNIQGWEEGRSSFASLNPNSCPKQATISREMSWCFKWPSSMEGEGSS